MAVAVTPRLFQVAMACIGLVLHIGNDLLNQQIIFNPQSIQLGPTRSNNEHFTRERI